MTYGPTSALLGPLLTNLSFVINIYLLGSAVGRQKMAWSVLSLYLYFTMFASGLA